MKSSERGVSAGRSPTGRRGKSELKGSSPAGARDRVATATSTTRMRSCRSSELACSLAHAANQPELLPHIASRHRSSDCYCMAVGMMPKDTVCPEHGDSWIVKSVGSGSDCVACAWYGLQRGGVQMLQPAVRSLIMEKLRTLRGGTFPPLLHVRIARACALVAVAAAAAAAATISLPVIFFREVDLVPFGFCLHIAHLETL